HRAVGVFDVEDHRIAPFGAPLLGDFSSMRAARHQSGQVNRPDFDVRRGGVTAVAGRRLGRTRERKASKSYESRARADDDALPKSHVWMNFAPAFLNVACAREASVYV